MGFIISRLSGWIDGWAPEQLVGGLPGRDARTIHEDLHQQIQDALDSGIPLVGGKLDVKKCFDTVHAQLAIKVFELLGAPVGMTKVPEHFYQDQKRWIEVEGWVADAAITPTMSILQGCRASMVLLAGLMAVWTKVVADEDYHDHESDEHGGLNATPWQQRRHQMQHGIGDTEHAHDQGGPNIEDMDGGLSVLFNIFVDDRALWATGQRAAYKIARALARAAVIDRGLGLAIETRQM